MDSYAQLVGRCFTEFYSKQPLCNMANPIPNIVLHPQFVRTTDSADFRGPIARPVSRFSLFLHSNRHGIRWRPHPNAGRVLTIFRAIFRVRSPDPFLTIFAIFSLKSPPNTMLTPSQQWQTTHDLAVLSIRPIFRVQSPDPFLKIFAIFLLKSPPNMMPIQTVAD